MNIHNIFNTAQKRDQWESHGTVKNENGEVFERGYDYRSDSLRTKVDKNFIPALQERCNKENLRLQTQRRGDNDWIFLIDDPVNELQGADVYQIYTDNINIEYKFLGKQ